MKRLGNNVVVISISLLLTSINYGTHHLYVDLENAVDFINTNHNHDVNFGGSNGGFTSSND